MTAESDFAAVVDIQPAPGFEGVEIVHGDPPPNSPPDASDDTAELAEGAVTVDVLANDTDADGHSLTVTAVSAPAHGEAAVEPDGRVTYTPGEGFSRSDSFTYTVSDGHGGTDTDRHARRSIRCHAGGGRTSDGSSLHRPW